MKRTWQPHSTESQADRRSCPAEWRWTLPRQPELTNHPLQFLGKVVETPRTGQ